MASDYTDYQNTDSSPPLDDKTGIIQPVEEVGGFSYRKRILYFLSWATEGGLSFVMKIKWRVRVRVSSSPTSEILFEQEIYYPVTGIPNVSFIPPANDGTFTTTIIDGQTIDPATAWQHVDTTRPTENSEFGIGIFSPNSGTVLGGVYVDITWQSPHYAMDLPGGAVFEVVSDNAHQYVSGPVIELYRTSTRPGTPKRRIDSTLDPFGDILVARVPEGRKVARVARLWPPFARGYGAARGAAIGEMPSILMLDDGLLIVGAMMADGYVEWTSENDGMRLERAVYPDAETGEKSEQVLFVKGAKVPQLVKIEGGRVAIAIQGGDLMARTIRDGGGFGSAGLVGGPVRIGAALPKESYSISEDESGTLWVFTSRGAPAFVLRGGTWKTAPNGGLINA